MSQSGLRFQSLADVKNRLLSEKHASMKPFRPKKVTSKLLDGGQRFDARTENFMAMVVVCTMLNLHVSILRLESSFSNYQNGSKKENILAKNAN